LEQLVWDWEVGIDVGCGSIIYLVCTTFDYHPNLEKIMYKTRFKNV